MATRYTATGSPGPYPVLLADVKSYLRVDSTADDDVITLMIEASTQFAETYISRDLRTRSWIATLDRFVEEFTDRIELRRNQIDTITAVKYFNNETIPVETTIPATDYYPRKGQWWGYVVLKSTSDWPDDLDDVQEEQRITVEFTTIPPVNIEQIQLALLRMIAAMYENRGDCGGCGTSAEAANLAGRLGGPFLSQFRIPRI